MVKSQIAEFCTNTRGDDRWNYFSTDNTEGYTQDQLDDLNARFAAATAHLDREDSMYDEYCQGIAERVLAEFDTMASLIDAARDFSDFYGNADAVRESLRQS